MSYGDLSEAQKKAVERWCDKYMDQYDYVDNERFATKGNIEQEKEYWRLEGRGCCGSADVELECDDGTVLMFGFNHGH